MRGYIKKRSSDSYSIVISLGRDSVSGKYKQRWITVHGTKKDAQQKLTEVLHEYDTGTIIEPDNTTLAEYLGRWLADMQPRLAPTTIDGYSDVINNYLVPGLGHCVLSKLTPATIQKYYADTLKRKRRDGRPGTLSNRTVRSHHMVLHRALKTAVRLRLIAYNPADNVDPPVASTAKYRAVTPEEMQEILEEVKGTPYYVVFYLLFYTGLRRSELLALKWENIDLVLCQLSVGQSLHQLHSGEIVYRQPKWGSVRNIALTPSTAVILRGYKETRVLEAKIIGRKFAETDLVFSHPDGSPLLPGSISRKWTRLMRNIGLDGVRLHDTRHTHATLMLKQGIPLKVVQERLGHKSIKTTGDIYAHVLPGMQEEAAAKFDEISNPEYKRK
ncbi:MAG: site-specific integrase [Dehalococcoides mccartyi]|uniref:tyrosine-type recombinase/integrase n=1 Tax=Dehalococcoides mccartyi TaxID=61435 RepID=UPI0030FC1E18